MARPTQTRTFRVSFKAVVHRAEFGRGYYQVLAGEPYVDVERDAKMQMTYERGRHSAAYLKSIGIVNLKLKKNKRVQDEVVKLCSQAKKCGALI